MQPKQTEEHIRDQVSNWEAPFDAQAWAQMEKLLNNAEARGHNQQDEQAKSGAASYRQYPRSWMFVLLLCWLIGKDVPEYDRQNFGNGYSEQSSHQAQPASVPKPGLSLFSHITRKSAHTNTIDSKTAEASHPFKPSVYETRNRGWIPTGRLQKNKGQKKDNRGYYLPAIHASNANDFTKTSRLNTADKEIFNKNNQLPATQQLDQSVANLIEEQSRSAYVEVGKLPVLSLMPDSAPGNKPDFQFQTPVAIARKMRYGLIMGTGLSIPQYVGNLKTRIQAVTGVFVNLPISKKISIEAAPQYRLSTGYNLSARFVDTLYNGSDYTIQTVDAFTGRLVFLECPLTVAMALSKPRFEVSGGIRPTMILPADTGGGPFGNDAVSIQRMGNRGGLASFDIAVQIGAEWKMTPGLALQLTYHQGWKDLSSNDWFNDPKRHLNNGLLLALKANFY